MPYLDSKVYFDGAHYIAIPHTTRFTKKKYYKPPPAKIKLNSEQDSGKPEPCVTLYDGLVPVTMDVDVFPDTEPLIQAVVEPIKETPVSDKTYRDLFNETYKESLELPYRERKKFIVEKILPYFKNEEQCCNFVKINLRRKYHNLVVRRTRMMRKAALVDFNYFVTFTYDSSKLDEASFQKKLKTCFRNLCNRKHWKYMGVWERAPETKRLHFHGLFYIPDGGMVGSLEEHTDYNFKLHKRTTTIQNTYFNKRFGRTDFEYIASNKELYKEINYILKYLEKTEEKIVYSKGLYQYFLADIRDEDVVCRIGREDSKLLLFDDFVCIDEGVVKGKVNEDIIAEMRKCN